MSILYCSRGMSCQSLASLATLNYFGRATLQGEGQVLVHQLGEGDNLITMSPIPSPKVHKNSEKAKAQKTKPTVVVDGVTAGFKHQAGSKEISQVSCVCVGGSLQYLPLPRGMEFKVGRKIHMTVARPPILNTTKNLVESRLFKCLSFFYQAYEHNSENSMQIFLCQSILL